MKVTVTPEVLEWFKKEIVIDSHQGIRFFGKVYGSTQVHEGFSVGMSVDQPERPLYQTTIDGVLFFVEESDDWFFQGYNMQVNYNEQLKEPAYSFSEINESND
ncbi:HesB/YadR/YfhF family protein [Enterococcus alcedinis]|uniref:Iron-sulfur cluster biosynthesis protein n=1 Tax=Enterococcus alcedinis TaxID=1274384 RepID=A0A917JD73_9ENTE|nr:iron-sulfur cluster biosynthesis protein [Enterococcus alcedinis]MBP2101192.1 uncharacterized protein YneR [Enterococcus alcedinis]GGI64509.1 iron-sulfur cluster biosynthesis protein [Enterococcus alcedinis]